MPGSKRTAETGPDLGAGELSALLAALPAALLLLDVPAERLVYANEEFRRQWRLDPALPLSEVTARMVELTAAPELFLQSWSQRAACALAATAPDTVFRLREGRELRWRTVSIPRSPKMTPYVAHLFDEVVPATAAAGDVPDDLFRLTFEQAAVGMALLSTDYRFLRTNGALCGLLGYEEPDLRALRLPELIPQDDLEARRSWELHSERGAPTVHFDQRLLRRSGEPIWAHLSVSVVRDASAQPACFLAQMEDVTQRKRDEAEQERREQALVTMATTDPITGLYNRRFMLEFLNHRLLEAKRTGQPVSVLMLDIDRFRELNEKHGQDGGDRALRSVAQCLQLALRENDLACRYGGDELLIVLAGAPLPAALAAAERLREQLREARPVAELEAPITCSMGVATFPAHASTSASLLKAADVALYQAKRSGRNRVCGYEPPPAQERPQEHLEALRAGLQDASTDAVKALVTAIDLRDRYTGSHCQRATRLAVQLAEHLGCPPEELEILRLGVPLLDVGKIGLRDDLLTKSSHLTPEEWSLIRQHPVWGEQLIRRAALPKEVLKLVRWHHERLDGTGYPDGLSGDEVPFLVRIVNVADVATALREDRPHRRAWPRERVLEYLSKQAPTKLDEKVVAAYCEVCRGR